MNRKKLKEIDWQMIIIWLVILAVAVLAGLHAHGSSSGCSNPIYGDTACDDVNP